VIYYDVLLPVPTAGVYTYISPDGIQRGTRVRVPIGKRELTGLVLKENTEPSSKIKYREILEIIDSEPVFTDGLLSLIKTISEYYVNPMGLALQGTIAKKILDEPMFSPEYKEFISEDTLVLNEEQKKVFDNIEPVLADGFSAHLIHGVTGSGKTEVFVDLAKKVIEKGKKVVYLVPEISLTPQLTDRISARLGFEIPVYHSKQTPKKRKDAFFGFASGTFPFLIGARSALFVPAKDIGLIIVDEEHESSYKQEEAPSYNMRDMAVMYAKILDIPVVMGSATPSIESWKNAREGRYTLHRLASRHMAEMPKIEMVDMKDCDLIEGFLTEKLYDNIYQTINSGGQAILLINRKGYSHTLYCRKCSETVKCLNCSVSLTYYKSSKNLKCHYCGQTYYKGVCGECGSDDVADYGTGTERAAEKLEELFGSDVLRLDTDTVGSIKKLHDSLEDFKAGKYKIMTGTQLVAKGLHFPDVTLVGVINIDNILTLPDFRNRERAFQLLMQVAGRAGRSTKAGKVIIQTYMPENNIFKTVIEKPDKFYEEELAVRQMFGYPPFMRAARLILSHSNEERVMQTADMLSSAMKSFGVNIKGPSPAPIFKIKNKYRYNILILGHDNQSVVAALHRATDVFNSTKKGNMILKIDRDPQFFM